jgi:hypothetical protein
MGNREYPMKKLLINKLKSNHALVMVLCCAVPMLLLFSLLLSGKLGTWGYYSFLLFCPLMHLLMPHHGHKSHSNKEETQKQIEWKDVK